MLDRLADIEWLLALALALMLSAFILHRRILRKKPLFFLYVVFEATAGAVLWIFRIHLFTPSIVAPKELLSDLLVLLIAVEETNRIMRLYPGIGGSLRLLLPIGALGFLAICLYLPELQPDSPHFFHNIIFRLHPWLLTVAALFFLLIAAAIFYYNLKIDRSDKRIILGFLIHLGPHAAGISIIEKFVHSEWIFEVLNIVYSAFYLTSLLIWLSIFWPRYELLDTTNRRPDQCPIVRAV